MKKFFTDDDSDGILLIDADNAFNRINRKVALWNIQHTCPALKHILINFYRSSSQIYVNSEGFFSLFQEGTTQGCPLSMAMYALGLAPMVKKLQPACKQVWFADDASGCDELVKLKRWYDDLLLNGPTYGYYPNPSKCILVVKPEKLDLAKLLFKDTEVNVQIDGSKDKDVEIKTMGARHLGAATGSPDFKRIYVKNKVTNWIDAVKQIFRELWIASLIYSSH